MVKIELELDEYDIKRLEKGESLHYGKALISRAIVDIILKKKH